MKYSVCVVLLVLFGLAVVVYTAGLWRDPELPTAAGAQAAEKQEPKPSGPPPLVVDKGAPLLLEEPPQKDPWDVPLGPVADNTACYCCHTNFEAEEFVVYHANANVGCVKCHGQSYAHRDDENNTTPPDTMFPPDKIEPNCRECHETHDAPAKDVITRWQERCAANAKPDELLCTDCHGQHRLKSRTVRWDKRTRQLILHVPPQNGKKAAKSTPGKTTPEKKKPQQP